MILKKNSLAFIALMGVAGCATNARIDQQNGCRLLSTYMHGVKSTACGNINFKRLDDQRIYAWVIFIPNSTENTPLKEPSLILKLYRGERSIDEIRISKGYTHSYFDRKRLETEFLKTGILKKIAKDPLAPDEPTEISSEEIWPRPMDKISYWDLREAACSFPLSREEFQRVMKAERMEVWIQTHAQPIVLKLDKDRFIHLENFQKTCLK